MASEIRDFNTMGTASPLNTLTHGLTRVAVLCQGPDGWRCYEAFHLLRTGEHWQADKEAAIAWTKQFGNKLDKRAAATHFHGVDALTFA